MAELSENPLAPDWGEIEQGNTRAVADALTLIWALLSQQKPFNALDNLPPGDANTVLALDSSALAPSWLASPTLTSLTLTGLLDLSGAGAGQIKFPASQHASGLANVFDDYEIGLWTPNDQSGALLTFTMAVGAYLKAGQMVVTSCNVTYPVTASGAAAVIGGFPYVTQNQANVFWGGFSSYSPANYSFSLGANASISGVYLNQAGVTNAALSVKNIELITVYRAGT